MKTIGLIGGMSWESTAQYYQIINKEIGARMGNLNSAKIVLFSVNFQEIEKLQQAGQWVEAGEILADAGRKLEGTGAHYLVLCTNTMHKVAPAIENATRIPLLHIADATAEAILDAGFRKVGLLGTRFTMEQAFYKSRLEDRFSLEVITPSSKDRQIIHDVIYQELCLGKIMESSRREYLRIIDTLVAMGAECIILGCTEISLLIPAQGSTVPFFDTTTIHARAAAIRALD